MLYGTFGLNEGTESINIREDFNKNTGNEYSKILDFIPEEPECIGHIKLNLYFFTLGFKYEDIEKILDTLKGQRKIKEKKNKSCPEIRFYSRPKFKSRIN